MATSAEIKSNNNTKIRIKTTAKSITKASVADQLDAGIDYIVQEVALKVDKVAGERLINTTEITKVANLSGANTGDETTATIKTKLGISTLSGSNTGDQDLSGKQDVLVSGTNIKTINGTSVLGSGNLSVLPYKSYTAIIRSVTGVATPTVMENSIGAIVISGNLNNFIATLLDAFPLNKTVVFASIANTSEPTLVNVNVNATGKSTALIPFETNLEYTDSEIYIEIRVYN